MPRVKGGYVTRQRRNRVLKLAKGYFGSKHTLYKTAHEQVMRSMAYSYRDRKVRKREFRKLWISRINAACKLNGIKYNQFICGLAKANVEVNRKMLAELAVNDGKAFAELVNVAKKGEVVVKASAKKAAAPKAAAKVEVKEAPKAEAQDLSKLTVAELKALAKEKGVEGYTTLKKAELIAALQ